MIRHLFLFLAFRTAACSSYVIRPGVWDFRGHPIAYEKAQLLPQQEGDADASPSEETSAAVNQQQFPDTEPVLLLNGFGVGSFHQHRLIHEILGGNDDRAPVRTSIPQSFQHAGGDAAGADLPRRRPQHRPGRSGSVAPQEEPMVRISALGLLFALTVAC